MIKQTIKLIWHRRHSNAFLFLEILAAFLVLVGVSTFGVYYWQLLRQPLGFSYENVWSIVAFEEGVEYGSVDRMETLQQIVGALKAFKEVKAIGMAEYDFYAIDVLGVENIKQALDMQPGDASGDKLPGVGSMTLEEMERCMIEKSMVYHNHNVSKVAEALGISRAALYRRLDKFGMKT